MMKKSRKILSLMLICLMMLSMSALITSCHGSRGLAAFEMPEDFDTETPIEITFWAKNDTNRKQVNIYQKAITDFEALYPNVTVNMRLYTDYGKIYNDVITNISTGTTPNVCITYPDHIATYMSGDNVVVPLDGIIDDPDYGLGGAKVKFDAPVSSEVVPEFLEECRINGELYALPYMRSTEALYINKTYVEKLGFRVPDVVTWDWIWKVSEKAAEKNSDGVYKVNGQTVMIPFIYKSTDNMMIQMLYQLQAPYSTADGEVKIFSDTTKALLLDIADHTAKGAFSTFKIDSYPANFLNAGQCIFAIDSTAGATWMGSEAPLLDIPADQVVKFETVVRMIPQFDTENPIMISQGPSVCIFNKQDPQTVLASWLFTQFLLTNDVQIAYSETEGYAPVTLKAQNTDEYRTYLSMEGADGNEHYSIKLRASRLLLDNTENTFTTPVFNGSVSLRDVAGQMIENVCKAVRRNQTVDEAYIDKMYEDVAAQYHLNQNGGTSAAAQKDLGPLPKTSVVLLLSVASVWIIIGIVYLNIFLKEKKEKRGS